MLASVTLDDKAGQPVTLHETGKRYLTKAAGLIGISPTRDVVRVRPQTHGSIDQSRFTDGSLIVLEGETFSTTIEDAYAEFRTIAAAMMQTLDEAPALLKWTEGLTGNQLQKLVKLASDVTPILEESAPAVRYQASFRAQDPRAYSQTLITTTGVTLGTSSGGDIYPDVYPTTYAPATGGTLAVNNVGNRPTPPIFRLYGGVTDADIILVGTEKMISLTGNIANGDYLEIDVQRRTLKLNGTSNALYYLDPISTTWFDLPAGTSTIQTVALAFDTTARCDVLYRAAYT